MCAMDEDYSLGEDCRAWTGSFIQKMLLFCLSVTEYSVFSANFARQIKFDSHYE